MTTVPDWEHRLLGGEPAFDPPKFLFTTKTPRGRLWYYLDADYKITKALFSTTGKTVRDAVYRVWEDNLMIVGTESLPGNAVRYILEPMPHD